jgi:hypothetical protein
VAPNSEVHHDGWAAYTGIRWQSKRIVPHRHIHENRQGNQRDFAESNLIEGLWFQLKDLIKKMYTSIPGDENFLGFIYEA